VEANEKTTTHATFVPIDLVNTGDKLPAPLQRLIQKVAGGKSVLAK